MAAARTVVLALAAPLALLGASAPARAQSTILTVSGAPISFAAPTATDLSAGYLDAPAPVTFTVDLRTGSAKQQITTTVTLASATTTLGPGKPIGDLLWSYSAPGSWQPLGTTPATLGVPTPMLKNKVNDTWSGTVYFRMLLRWTDPPGSYSGTVELTLTVTTP